MNITENNTVAEIVTNNIKTADVFKKNGIDFCCGGGISIKKACEKKGLPLEIILNELTNVNNPVSNAHNYDNWKLDFLVDHIVNIHHTYVTESIPLILQYAARVAKVHGHHYTEVVEINKLFIDVANELSSHLKKEEQVLFPFIKELQNRPNIPPFGMVLNGLIAGPSSGYKYRYSYRYRYSYSYKYNYGYGYGYGSDA